MKHIMIDLETLGTKADSVILSIGAVRFDLDSEAIDDNGFYQSVSVASNLESGRKIDESTLIWWMSQEKAAQRVFTEPKVSLEQALTEFYAWVDATGVPKKDIMPWSNGANFDLPMMEHAIYSFGWDMPWEFWNARCFRTFKEMPFAKRAKKPANGAKHNALSDAVAQAKHAQAIQAVLKGLK